VTGRMRCPPYRPMPHPAAGPGRHIARVAPSPGKSRSAGRNAAHCPGRPLHPQGHPKILSNRCAERIFRTHPCTRSLWRPSGPDGKGQARGQAPGRAPNPHIDAPQPALDSESLDGVARWIVPISYPKGGSTAVYDGHSQTRKNVPELRICWSE
jgi:hypothetical protein